MPLASTAFENAALDACYGDDHSDVWPDEFTVHLFDEDPRDAGVELVGDGYTVPTIDNDTATFPDATSGAKTSIPIEMGTATADWETVRWWLLKDPSDDTWVETAQFSEPIDVFDGSTLKVRLVIANDPEAL